MNMGEGRDGGVSAIIAPLPTFLAGRAFRGIGMPFGKRGKYAAKSLPHPRYRGEESTGEYEIKSQQLRSTTQAAARLQSHIHSQSGSRNNR
jgi:hypothetical protein